MHVFLHIICLKIVWINKECSYLMLCAVTLWSGDTLQSAWHDFSLLLVSEVLRGYVC